MDIGRHFEYEIQYARAAEKFFRKHESVREKYEDAVKEFLGGEHPETVDIKQIKGKRSVYYRIALGGYRVLFTTMFGPVAFLTIPVGCVIGGAFYDYMSGMISIRRFSVPRAFYSAVFCDRGVRNPVGVSFYTGNACRTDGLK